MIAVTVRAKKELKRILVSSTNEPGACVRLYQNAQNHLGLSVDEARQDDHKIEHQGKTLLLVEERLSDLLNGITIDIEETPEGVKLVLSQES